MPTTLRKKSYRPCPRRTPNKNYADSKAHLKPSSISVEDTVVVQRDPSTMKSPYMPEPYTVAERKGSMITAKSGNTVTTQIPRNTLNQPDNSSDGDDDSPTIPFEEAVEDQGNKNQTFRPEIISTRGRLYPERNRRPPGYLRGCLPKSDPVDLVWKIDFAHFLCVARLSCSCGAVLRHQHGLYSGSQRRPCMLSVRYRELRPS